jgi:hypothetical protein
LKGFSRDFLYDKVAAIPSLLLSSGASGSEQLQLTDGELPFFEQEQKLLPNSSTGAKDSNIERTIGESCCQAVVRTSELKTVGSTDCYRRYVEKAVHQFITPSPYRAEAGAAVS